VNVFEAIEQGLHDEELDQLITACKNRAKLIPLEVGDIVRVNEQASPKYMQGVKGKIISLTNKQKYGGAVYLVEVLPDEQHKLAGTKMVYYSGGVYKTRNIDMPRSLITKVTVD
jgi:hypothetical protein